MTPADIDRLAAFCRLSEKGYRRHTFVGTPLVEWRAAGSSHDDGYWRPDESDDDCRVVLEACREKGIITRVADELYGKFCVDTSDWGINAELSEWMLMVSPEQKCQAVLKVIGDQT